MALVHDEHERLWLDLATQVRKLAGSAVEYGDECPSAPPVIVTAAANSTDVCSGEIGLSDEFAHPLCLECLGRYDNR
jgi:hypothetical protein